MCSRIELDFELVEFSKCVVCIVYRVLVTDFVQYINFLALLWSNSIHVGQGSIQKNKLYPWFPSYGK